MTREGKLLLGTTALAMAACSMDTGKLEIRSTPTALAQGTRPVPQRIAEARGQLAIGNVALALQAFRIAWRDDPNSTDALAGMANCYDQMGRYDLSRRYYETALALAPADTQLLGALATSLQRQGLNEEANKVKEEIAARSISTTQPALEPEMALRAPAAAPAPELADISPMKASAATLPENLLATPRATMAVEAVTTSPAPFQRREFVAPVVQLAEATAPRRVAISLPVAPSPVVEDAPVSTSVTAPVGQSVTIKLPRAHHFQAASAATPVAKRAPVAETSIALPPLKPSSALIPQPSFAADQGPRLERLSMGEIGLITTSHPVWQSITVDRTATSAKVRFIPLREASTTPVRVRLLNAARVDRLAARTRNWLSGKGWRGMVIGNAYAVRKSSVILYSADTRWLAQRLSRQFGFPMAPKKGSVSRQVMVLLGTDAARHPALKRRV